ncbi:hypothetical protein QTP88_022349 [Uroleucon formosanum]
MCGPREWRRFCAREWSDDEEEGGWTASTWMELDFIYATREEICQTTRSGRNTSRNDFSSFFYGTIRKNLLFAVGIHCIDLILPAISYIM